MKKHWKLIVGILFLIGGIGCVTTDLGAFAFGVVVGCVLIAWEVLPQQLNKNKQKTISSTQQPFKNVSNHTPSSDDVDVKIPSKIDGATLAYHYSVPFETTEMDAAYKAALEKRWYLKASIINGKIHLFSDAVDLGILTQREDMLKDWIKRGDPYLIVLQHVNSESGCTVFLAFYRDKTKQYAYRQQSVVALVSYKSEEKQENMILNEGDEVEAVESFDNDVVTIESSLGPIGNLPRNIASRYLNEGAALIVFDHEEDDDNFKSRPYVRIYW